MSDYPSVLPPSATALEFAIEQVGAKAVDLPIDWRGFYDFENAPAALLPFLAWQESVDDYPPDATEAQKREIIRAAFSTHRYKGTVRALEDAIAPFNLLYQLQDRLSDGLAPYTFILTLFADASYAENGVIITEGLINRFIRTVEAVKPLRAAGTYRIGAKFDRNLNISLTANIVTLINLTADVKNPITISGDMNISVQGRVINFINITAEVIQ